MPSPLISPPPLTAVPTKPSVSTPFKTKAFLPLASAKLKLAGNSFLPKTTNVLPALFLSSEFALEAPINKSSKPSLLMSPA